MQHSTEYKKRQEDFVSDIRGTTPLEVFGLSFSVILVPLLEQYVKVWLINKKRKFGGDNSSDWSVLVVGLEILLKIVFYFLIQTVFILNRPVFESTGTFSMNLISLWLIVIVLCFIFKYYINNNNLVNNRNNSSGGEANSSSNDDEKSSKTISTKQHVEFLSEYRHSMQLSTIMAILMVDFTLFPRRLCKAETFGYTLMDLGVGSFVFSGAIVSNSARRVVGSGGGNSSISLSKILHSLLPLVCLAFFRFFTVQTVNYQTHVTEYGTHWNFFTTLAVLYILSLVADYLKMTTNWRRSILSGLICIAVQQILLSCFNLQHVILFGERSNFILANKEGFGTLLGYFSIHLLGVGIGQFTFSYHSNNSKYYLKLMVIFSIFTILVTFIPFYYFGGHNFIELPTSSNINNNYNNNNNNNIETGSTYHYQMDNSFFQNQVENLFFSILIPSRRMTNLGYVIYTISFNITLVTLFYLVSMETRSLPSRGNCIVRDSMNFNPLFSFLFANIMTGLLNLSIHTIDASFTIGTLVILAYGMIICLADIYLFIKKRRVF